MLQNKEFASALMPCAFLLVCNIRVFSLPMTLWCGLATNYSRSRVKSQVDAAPTSFHFSWGNAGEEVASSGAFALLNWKELGGARGVRREH